MISECYIIPLKYRPSSEELNIGNAFVGQWSIHDKTKYSVIHRKTRAPENNIGKSEVFRMRSHKKNNINRINYCLSLLKPLSLLFVFIDIGLLLFTEYINGVFYS